MKTLENFINLSYLGILSALGGQRLARTPEPDLVTTSAQAVADYNRALDSSLTLLYALDICFIDFLTQERARTKALDLACGPGILTLWLAQELKLNSIQGLDLSEPMIASAKERFLQAGWNQNYGFHKQDITDLSRYKSGEFDLVTCMDASHHLPDPELVTKMLTEAERVCSPEGIIFISDIVRPKSQRVFDFYYKWISKQNDELNMKAHNEDFYNSLHAAWTCEELASFVPKETSRRWYQIYPQGFPYMQMVFALPQNSSPFSFKGFQASGGKKYIPQSLHSLWAPTHLSFQLASRVRRINK